MPYIEDGFDEKPEATPRDLFPEVAFVVNFLLYAFWFGVGYWYGHDAARPAIPPVATARDRDYAVPPVVTGNPAYAPPSVGCRFVGDDYYRRMVEAYANEAAANEARAQQKIDPPVAAK
jgi:hypothetical protein